MGAHDLPPFLWRHAVTWSMRSNLIYSPLLLFRLSRLKSVAGYSGYAGTLIFCARYCGGIMVRYTILLHVMPNTFTLFEFYQPGKDDSRD